MMLIQFSSILSKKKNLKLDRKDTTRTFLYIIVLRSLALARTHTDNT